MKDKLVKTPSIDASEQQRQPKFHRSFLMRPVLIDICKDGTVTYRKSGEKRFNGAALPAFSVDTEEQAKMLQVRFCSLQYGHHPKMPDGAWYKLTDFGGTLDALEDAGVMFNDWWQSLKGGE